MRALQARYAQALWIALRPAIALPPAYMMISHPEPAVPSDRIKQTYNLLFSLTLRTRSVVVTVLRACVNQIWQPANELALYGPLHSSKMQVVSRFFGGTSPSASCLPSKN